jgi:hypothetical protein
VTLQTAKMCLSLINPLILYTEYILVKVNDGGISIMDCTNANYLGHIDFCGTNGLGNFYFSRQSAKMIFNI